MFRLRSNKFEVTEGDPIFEIRYLGCRETDRAFGTDCTTAAVSGLWVRCPYEKALPKGFLQVGMAGVSLSLGGQIVLHEIRNVSYCCVESCVNERIFSWIYRMSIEDESKGEVAASSASSQSKDSLQKTSKEPSICSDEDETSSNHQRLFLHGEEGTYRFMCHAVLATKKSRAQIMCTTLRRAFHVAFKDWKRDRSRDERSRHVKSLTERSQTLNRAVKSESDCTSEFKDLDLRSVVSEGADVTSTPASQQRVSVGETGESSSPSQEEESGGIREGDDAWSLSGNE